MRSRIESCALVSVMALAAFGATLQPHGSGLDLASIDSAIRPQDDLFQYANGGWLRTATIPPDRVSYGTYAELMDRSELDVRSTVEELQAKGPYRRGSPAQQIVDLYSSIVDEARIERLGADPLRPELQKIAAIASTRELATEIGYLSSIAAGGPFAGSVVEDGREPGRLMVQLTQGGTLLPSRDYYLKQDPSSRDIRAAYQQYLARIFQLAGPPTAAADAAAVLALETDLARLQWDAADARALPQMENRFPLARLSSELPGFDWLAWAKPQGIDRVEYVVFGQPSFFRGFAALVPQVPLSTWKAWLAARYITATSPFVSRTFADARFDFFGRVLSGQALPRERWKRGVSLVNGYLGDAVGRMYVARRFPPAAKAAAGKLMETMNAAFREAIGEATWMGPATRREALRKLDGLSAKVGQPEEWREYRGLEIKPDDLVGNIERAKRFENADRMAEVNGQARGPLWLMPPQMVNAYYSPARNEIVVTAAMLQPPLFSLAADAAVNYGGVGAVIGHEIGHAFDDRGRRFDALGAARDWWTAEDERAFAARARVLVRQFDACSPFPGVRVNGTLTLAENLGDLAGLEIALRAYRISLRGAPSPSLDGFTGDQRFFIAWAQAWRAISHEEYERQLLTWNPYAPARFRANVPVSNMTAFYAAFEVKAGDGLYRAPADRVSIWAAGR